MKSIANILHACLFTAFATMAYAGPAPADILPVNLTLKDAVKMAVERNLDVKVELYNTATAEADIRKNRGIYDPLLHLLTGYTDSKTQPVSTLLAGATTDEQQSLQYNVGINRLLPSGGTVGAAFNNTWYRSNADPTKGFINRYYESEFSVNFSQPLLKNFGREATELNITVAGFGKDVSREQFTTRLTDTVARVRNEYFKLSSLREDLEAKRSSLKLANQILSDTRGRVRAGVLASMEILNAEFGVASREKDLIDAERAVKDQEDVLRLLLQLGANGEIIPVEAVGEEPLAISEEAAVERALSTRNELRSARVNIRINELQTRVADNRTRPDLTFTASAATTGLAKEYGSTLEKVGSAQYPVWGIGLQLDVPLGNNTARNELIKSRLKTEQSKTQLQSLEASTINEVKSAIRAVAAGYKQLQATDKARAYAEQRLQSFIKKSEVGLATTKDVFDVENDLTTARSNQIAARTNYANAVTQLWRATGELLEKEGINLSGGEGDKLYEQAAGGNHG